MPYPTMEEGYGEALSLWQTIHSSIQILLHFFSKDRKIATFSTSTEKLSNLSLSHGQHRTPNFKVCFPYYAFELWRFRRGWKQAKVVVV